MPDRPAPPVSTEVRGRLGPAEVTEVTALVEAVTEADGVGPLSEHVVLHLRHGGDAPGRNALVRAADGTLVAYAHLDVTDPVEGASAELAVHPDHRRRGLGRALVGTLLREAPGGRLRLWAHGSGPAAAALARSAGFEQVRELWQLRRPLTTRLPEAALPDGVAVRTFRPGEDDDAWLALNARAFAHHPEQGAWTAQDLRGRMAEPWFDPAGFFLAERAGRLVAFHWTKVHGSDATTHGHDPVGEVYVVGVDPDAQGGGLGRAMTVVGLRHLRARGLTTVMLYVEADNTAALRTYSALGFQRWDVDVMYRMPGR